MFIAGIVFGPALAILLGRVPFTQERMKTSWAWLVAAILMLVVAVVPFFPAELKAGLLLGLPLGLLIVSTPMTMHSHVTDPTSARPADR